MHALVTGATGFVGQHLVRALCAAGQRVRTLGRNSAVNEQLRALGAEVVAGDLRDAHTVAAACAGVQTVFHVGALSAPWGKAADFFAHNVTGTANVVAGCRAHGVARLVQVSSPSVTFAGQDVIEQTEAAPYPARYLCAYSRSKQQAEDVVQAAYRAGLATVIVRPKAVFGPGDTSLLPRLIAAARAGRLPQIGSGTNRVALTYVANVVQALQLAATAERAVGGTYTITNDAAPPLWDVVRRVLQACGVTRALRTLPFGVAYALASVLEWAGRLTGREPSLTRYTAAVLGRTQTYDLTAARRDLGYAPVVSLDAGIEQTLAAFAPPTPARWFVPTAVQQRVEVLTTGYCTAQRGHVLRGGGATQIQCQALVVLLQHPQHGWWLFDTGYAPRLLDATARLPFRLYRWATPLHLRPELAVAAQLPRFGIAPADIGTVVLSHFHADHLAGVRDMPAARFVARQTAYADVAERRGLAALRRAFVPSLLPTDFAQRATLLPAFTGPSLGELGPTHDLFGDGSALLVELPGHAVGQLGLFVTSPRGPLLFVADAAWLSESIRTNTPPPGLVRLIVADYAALCATIGKLHRFAQAHPDVAIIPCHCPEAFARWVA